MLEIVIIAALAVGGRGPAWSDWRRRRRQGRDFPTARVAYLPSACCR